MIKSHPTEAQLHKFVTGDLGSALSLVVATHVDMCSHCQHMVSALEDEVSEELLAHQAPLADSDSQLMLDSIFSSEAPATETKLSSGDASSGLITLEGRRFKLPRSLACQQARIGPWNKMMGKMWRASLSLGTEEVANLIYMSKGTGVPEHTHKGTEATLVIDGTFSDEFGTYNDGDFIMLDGSRQHSPKTMDEDCLILAVLDDPLHFTSGISRLLNPFSSLFFR
ncbi:ChrR family anti-sigma-E factor [Aliidiomarina sp. Khilg15.8]